MSTRADRTASPPAAGGVVIAGKYRLECELGRGGMGAVYAARHVVTGRRFAIKLLGRELRGDARAEARFLREATLASSIQHPAIVEVYDVGCDRGQPYMVMRLLHGETLSQRLTRGPLPPAQAIALLLPVVDAVAAAHACGIVHRDLKPDNVMLEREGELEHPRVLDFGISKLMSSDTRSRITHPGVLMGTPEYMSPEQVRGEPDLDARTDIYSLGVMLHEMLTGFVPYEAEDCPQLLRKIIDGGAPGVRAYRPELAVGLEAVVARAMARAPEVRHRDAGELARDLAAFAGVRAAGGSDAVAATVQPPDSITPLTTAITIAQIRSLRPRIGLYALVTSALLGVSLALSALHGRAPDSTVPPAAPAAAAMPASAPAANPIAPHGRDPSDGRPAPPAAVNATSLAAAAAAAAPPLAAVQARRSRFAPATERLDRKPRRSHRPRREQAEQERLGGPSAPVAAAAVAPPSVTSELLDPFD